jgi:hypothetical protein
MSQLHEITSERRSWWERLLDSIVARRDDAPVPELPPDSLFAGAWTLGAGTVADVPEKVKAQLRDEAILDTFNRLEASLRLLLYATTPGKEPADTERYRQILSVWRYELEHRVNLTPDTYCGAVQFYQPEMESAYTIDGRCAAGDRLLIRVPCWRMNDQVVIRGEAELLDDGGAPSGASAAGAAPDGY